MSSSSLEPQTKYDVYLSSREDTRKNFTSHLHAALCQNGIQTFFDVDVLKKGMDISLELLKVIEDSRCSIVILSNEYASSSWCLNELVKIVECMTTSGQIVIPIFYQVDPSVVRNQTGRYEEAIRQHEQHHRNDSEKLQSWRAALTRVASLAGREVRDDTDEPSLIQDVVVAISEKLRS
ncbi:hypothetical protein FNV43_RR16286 [Rhamnella rubrinervis]|uniref:ADP-ribosyl cyclase/cyclic ADP-ribose hydrolase n=1 Tax=Rhamnella rubrinervis TaxID=2594499 RepID=A0A8K0MCM4_9ROSA|nr:hypothetical protein FNV43_RR16286 [Rhamnella rubrinervis]